MYIYWSENYTIGAFIDETLGYTLYKSKDK